MRLILHAGLPKTGSSFLQSFFYEKRKELEKNGIYFPIDRGLDERSITKAGNAKDLHLLIHKNSVDEIIHRIKKYCEEAAQNSCGNILLSHEGFYNSFPNILKNKKFSTYLSNSEISQVDIILVLRNPHDLLVSLYKQKCRSGKRIKPVSFLNQTKIIDCIYDALKLPEKHRNINLHCINYDTNKNLLTAVFTKTLLRLTDNHSTNFNYDFKSTRINRSLTFNQIKCLQFVSLFHKGIAVRISNTLQKSFYFKESLESIKDFKSQINSLHKDRIRELIPRMNAYLPDDENIISD